MLVRGLALLTALCVASMAFAQADDPLPLPAELEPNFHFWLRIYTEIDGRGGLIHDSENLAVVYEVARFPEGLSYRARERRVEKIKKRYRAVLQRLGKGKRSDLSREEARVLSRWPEGVSNRTLARATNRVRFQLGQADRFREGIARSGIWAENIERVLEQYGVLRELVALPHVESSFNPRAYSRVGAAGLWQFTRSTGRLYLRVDHVVDERMDPDAATDAAARLLRDNPADTDSANQRDTLTGEVSDGGSTSLSRARSQRERRSSGQVRGGRRPSIKATIRMSNPPCSDRGAMDCHQAKTAG